MEVDFQTSLQCGYCQKYSKDIKKCSRCKLVLYCNQECQKKHWNLHKENCKNLQIKNEVKKKELFKIQRPIEEKFEQLLGYNQDKSIKIYLTPQDEQFEEIKKDIIENGEKIKDKREGYIGYYYCFEENGVKKFEKSKNEKF